MQFKNPPALKPKDRVAIISPSAGLAHDYPHVFEQGLERLREVFELEPVEFPTARKSSKYLEEHPEERAGDINAAFKDPSIKAIISTIGGNDQIRILPYLNSQMICDNPKKFFGFSDCTNLHLYLWNLGIISYYGGSVMNQFAMEKEMHPFTVDYLKRAFFQDTIGEILSSPFRTDVDLNWSDKDNLTLEKPTFSSDGWEWHHLKKGIDVGRLWGGCLECITPHLALHRYLPTDEFILFLETSEEMPTDGFVYRFFATLAEMGLLKKITAILMGYPKTQFCGIRAAPSYIEEQKTAVLSALRNYHLSIPVIFNLNFGHTDPQVIIPSGSLIKINYSNKTLKFC